MYHGTLPTIEETYISSVKKERAITSITVIKHLRMILVLHDESSSHVSLPPPHHHHHHPLDASTADPSHTLVMFRLLAAAAFNTRPRLNA